MLVLVHGSEDVVGGLIVDGRDERVTPREFLIGFGFGRGWE
jgi:hypothetical protein